MNISVCVLLLIRYQAIFCTDNSFETKVGKSYYNQLFKKQRDTSKTAVMFKRNPQDQAKA